jgi:2-keto-4-pentenoate hydratase/2-oxohepta-3-ene-1,7-dioic acid hydratase in catechol pathway
LKLISFEHAGRPGYGVVQSDQVLLPSGDFLSRYPDIVSLLRADALSQLAQAVKSGTALKADTLKALPVVPNPQKFICVGLNYKTHVSETKRDDSKYPALFVRWNDSLTAHDAEVPKPSFSDRFDWEGELAVVIGRGGRDISEADAFDHIAGYSCFNDITVRDWQRHTHQWTPGKNFPGTGALGPWFVTADEVGDVNALKLQTRLNGEVMQSAALSDLIFTLPVLLNYISRFTPLSPGDVIATGTPGGVGDRRNPPVYMKPGDVVEVEITKLGTLRNRIGTAN